MKFDASKLVPYMLPVLISCLVWLVNNIKEQEKQITVLQHKMMLLVSPQGNIVPSGGSAREKAEITEDLHKLDKRITILENK